MVSFYQTLARQGEVPYVIESSPLDPFNQVLFSDQALSVGTVDSGTWSTNGTVTVVSAAPLEGAGTLAEQAGRIASRNTRIGRDRGHALRCGRCDRPWQV